MRFEGQKRMGFYKTPVCVVELIKSFIEFNSKNKVLDICSGCGEALHYLAYGTDSKTYGVELDNLRAEESAKVLDHVLKTDFKNTRISNNCFNLLFLNPSYDDESTIEGNTRKEKIFLIHSVKYLIPEGLLVYIISKRRLDESIAKFISYRFENIRVFRFHGKEYDLFKQIIVMGTKKKKNSVNDTTFDYLKSVPFIELPEIAEPKDKCYFLPKAKEVSIFKSTAIDINDLKREVACSALWKLYLNRISIEEHKIVSPPLPLHKGHIALLLASGKLDGVVGKEEDRHLIRGAVEKVITKVEEIEEKSTVIRESERFRVRIKILNLFGEIRTLTQT